MKDIIRYCGEWGKTEALSGRRKNMNRQTLGVGGRGTLCNMPESWDLKDSQDSKGGILDEILNSE